MAPRSELHTLLKDLLETDYVYFQPPPNLQMEYPCIVYRRDNADTDFADNKPYSYKKRYLITVIDRDPDSVIPERIASIPTCVFDRFYAADNLNHDTYRLYF